MVHAEGVVVVSSSTEVTPHLYWGHVTDDIQVMWAGAIVLVLVDTTAGPGHQATDPHLNIN